ncbi:MAG TPA: bacillithiol biosynthesis deacetylase BshB1 [Bryobacteraceae bacterium]|nr:bacillithiol biosynthesis deacetylase BshB1 [Bryobacteraceae bacterium]
MVDLLAIAAHPDDVEQTCGGALLRAAEAGYRTAIVDLTSGEMGTRGTPEIRLQEAAAAAKVLRVSHRANMQFPDTRVMNTPDAREKLAMEIRRLKPTTVILPWTEARHPDHYHAAQLGFDASFLAGLRKLDPSTDPGRPRTIVYASAYSKVEPSFVLDITRQFDRRMEALFCYSSQYGAQQAGSDLFPHAEEIRERFAGIARYYGNLIGVRYGEPYVMKETMRIDDLVTMPVRSF